MESSIVKNTLHAGKQYIPLTDGCKVHFHFQTWKLGKERILLDDSRKIGKKEPMVLVIGHKFKLEVWENIIKLMAVDEVASFQVKKELVFNYPLVSKTLRELDQPSKSKKHACTLTVQTEGLGYQDLDDFMRNPCDLEFVIELVKVERPQEYQKDTWLMTLEERLEYIPELKKKGNKLYGNKLYDEAETVYCQAIGLCDQLMLRERKGDEDWIKYNEMRLPILLNYAQCRLVKGDYYSVIEHCTTILQFDEDNEKALFRRAKAHVGVWNLDLAEKDFNKLKDKNPSLKVTINNELENIKRLRKEKEELEKQNFKNLFNKGDSVAM